MDETKSTEQVAGPLDAPVRRFWFDGNMACGYYPADWPRIKDAYPDEDLRTALACPSVSGIPSFGFYQEHVGPQTLGEFLLEHGLPY